MKKSASTVVCLVIHLIRSYWEEHGSKDSWQLMVRPMQISMKLTGLKNSLKMSKIDEEIMNFTSQSDVVQFFQIHQIKGNYQLSDYAGCKPSDLGSCPGKTSNFLIFASFDFSVHVCEVGYFCC